MSDLSEYPPEYPAQPPPACPCYDIFPSDEDARARCEILNGCPVLNIPSGEIRKCVEAYPLPMDSSYRIGCLVNGIPTPPEGEKGMPPGPKWWRDD